MLTPKSINVFDVQNMLRQHATQGVDFTHPHGVLLHGRVYPTMHKSIMIDDAYPDDSHFMATIPLESGNKIVVRSKRERPSRRTPTNSHTVSAVLNYPYRFDYPSGQTYYSFGGFGYSPKKESALHHTENGKNYYYDPEWDEKEHDITADNAHETIMGMNKVPFGGKVGKHEIKNGALVRSERPMTVQELKSHTEVYDSVPTIGHTTDDIHESEDGALQSVSHLGSDGKKADVIIPKGNIHIEQFGPRYAHLNHYAYDPINETLKKIATHFE